VLFLENCCITDYNTSVAEDYEFVALFLNFGAI
jgi:hypothetical protein